MQTDLAINAPMFFARGGDDNYMMRSERRSGHGGGVPPKKRRKRPTKHPLYAFFTILALITLFPIGLILLWVPKLRWSKTTKLVVTLATGIVFFLLMAVALNYKTDVAWVTGAQDQAKSGLTQVMDTVRETTTNTDKMKENLFYYTPKAYNDAMELALDAAGGFVTNVRKNTLAVIGKSNDIASAALDGASDAVNWIGGGVRSVLHIEAAKPEDTVEPSLPPKGTPAPVTSDKPAYTPSATDLGGDSTVTIIGGADGPTKVYVTDAKATAKPEAESTPGHIAEATIEPAASAASEPPAEATIGQAEGVTAKPAVDATVEPAYEPTQEPTLEPTPEPTPEPTSEPTPEPTLEPTPEPTAEPTPEPTLEPTTEPTAEPTPEQTAQSTPAQLEKPTAEPSLAPAAQPSVAAEPLESAAPQAGEKSAKAALPAIKPYGESKVYYFDGSKYYHRNPDCGNMHDANEHTLVEAQASGKPACPWCAPPAAALLKEENVVWCGEDGVFHITDECPALTKNWTAMKFDEAWLEEGMNGCSLCGSSLYIEYRTKNPVTTPVPAPPVIDQP